MKSRHTAIVGFVAALSLLAFVVSTWMAPLTVDSTTNQVSHSKHLLCSVPTSSLVYIQIKQKLPSVGTGFPSVFAISPLLPQFKTVGLFEPRKVAVDIPRPLWLLHRSILI